MPQFDPSDELLYQFTMPTPTGKEQTSHNMYPWSDELLYVVTAYLYDEEDKKDTN